VESLPELRFLQRLALAAASTLDEADLVRLVIAETTEACRTDVCSIYLLRPEGDRLELAATNGLSQAGVGRVSLAVGEGITGHAAAERCPVVVRDVRDEPRFRWLHGVDQARFVSMCATPILSGDRLVGVLNVQTDEPRDFNAGEVELLGAIAAQVAGVLERSELQKRLRERLDALRLSDEIQRDFSELALTGAGLMQVCQAIVHHAGGSAAVFDEEGEMLAGSASWDLADRLEALPADDRIVVKPLRAGPDRLGRLVVRAGEEQAPGRDHAIEHGRTVLALELVRERAAAEAERRLRGDLLGELLSRPHTAEAARELADRATRLGLRIRDRAWVVLIDPDDPRSRDTLSSVSVHRRVTRALADVVADRGGVPVELGGGVALILPGDAPLVDIERLAERARGAAERRAEGASLSAGIGSAAGAPEDLHRLAGEAAHALAVARTGGAHGVVSAHARLGVDRLLFAIDDRDALRRFVVELLGPLAAHDDTGKASAPLVHSLEALIAEGWNLRAAARRLNVHINTLLYRIKKMEEIAGRRMDDPDQRLAYTMALRAQAMLAPPRPEPVAAETPAESVLELVDEPEDRPPAKSRGVRVGITAARKADEQAALVRSFGGVPVMGPSLRADESLPREEIARELVDALAGTIDIVVFLTGAGVEMLLSAARECGIEDRLGVALERARVIARGPKPRKALRAADIRIDATLDPPRMTAIRDLLLSEGVDGKRILIQGFGPPPRELATPLRRAGATVNVLSPYARGWPADPGPAMDLASQAARGKLDALTFTSAQAARQFMALADERGVDSDAINASGVMVVAVGPVTEAALAECGLTVHIAPERGKMGTMYRALADALGQALPVAG
jgi:uroporphyrinogen-III synthase/sugar diacid utilization regulator/putative methionine-R-sulfoxide reductase with GAF domain